MVSYCVLCRRNSRKYNTLSFHRFPKRPEVLQKWMKAVDVEGFKITTAHRICSDHFGDDSFQFRHGGGQRHLKEDAVPSLFLSKEDALILKAKKRSDLNRGTPRKIVIKQPDVRPNEETTDSPEEAVISNGSQSNFTQPNKTYKVLYQVFQENSIQPDVQPSKETTDSPEEAGNSQSNFFLQNQKVAVLYQVSQENIIQQVKIENASDSEEVEKKEDSKSSKTKERLRREIKNLQAQLRRRDKKISRMKGLISDLKSKKNDTKNLYRVLEEHFSGFPLEMVLNLLKNKSETKTTQAYSPSMKTFALTLYSHSPKAYKFIRSLFHLPHPSGIKKWISLEKEKLGLTSEVSDCSKIEVEKNSSLKMSDFLFESS